MTITYSPEVKALLKASGMTDAQVKTSEVKAAQAQNQARQQVSDPLAEQEELSPRFIENALDLPKAH